MRLLSWLDEEVCPGEEEQAAPAKASTAARVSVRSKREGR
jgi:hypothetical protein